jgi:hypothetical protein
MECLQAGREADSVVHQNLRKLTVDHCEEEPLVTFTMRIDTVFRVVQRSLR